MVQSAVLKKVIEPIQTDEGISNQQLHPIMDKYKETLNSPVYSYLKDYPVHIIDNDTITVSSSKQIFQKIDKEKTYTIKIIGEEFQTTHIFIVVAQNTNAKLHIVEKNPKSYTQYTVIVEKNSTLTIGREITGTTYSSLSTYIYENSSCPIIGAYSIENHQALMFTSASLMGENTNTDIKMYGIAKNNAYATNDTTLYVDQKAPNSNGYQDMRNIIGDSTSRVTSKPILEIHNYQVKCSHGASVSPLPQNMRHYGLSRGIDEESLKELISEGFFELAREAIK